MSEQSSLEHQDAPLSECRDPEMEARRRQARRNLKTLAKIFFTLGKLCDKKASTIPVSDPPPSEGLEPSESDDATLEVQPPDEGEAND